MKNNSNLILPTEYSEMTCDEMYLIDGGAKKVNYWWGWAINLNSSECEKISDVLDAHMYGAGGVGALSAAIAAVCPIAGGAGAAAAAIYGVNVGIAKTKLKAAASAGRGATLSKNVTGYHVNIW